MSEQKPDQPYQEAAMRAVGRGTAEMMMGMIEGGMSRTEALQAVMVYLSALGSQRSEKKDDDSET